MGIESYILVAFMLGVIIYEIIWRYKSNRVRGKFPPFSFILINDQNTTHIVFPGAISNIEPLFDSETSEFKVRINFMSHSKEYAIMKISSEKELEDAFHWWIRRIFFGIKEEYER